MNFELWLWGNLTIDHIKPKKHGGTDDNNNLAVACHCCNKLKGQEMCTSITEGQEIIERKRGVYRDWFNRFVLQKT